MKQPSPFGDWLREHLRRRGYDLSVRGSHTRFAEASGIAPATLTRILANKGTVDVPTLKLLADALGLPLGELLIQAGVATADDLRRVSEGAPPGEPPFTPDRAAEELGIVDPVKRRLFTAMTKELQREDRAKGQAADQ